MRVTTAEPHPGDDTQMGDPGSDDLTAWLREGWAQAPDLAQVAVEGASVHYRLWKSQVSVSSSLLFVHGFIAHAAWWDHIAPRFTDRFRVAALDFTGMGDSDHRPSYCREQYGREILAVIDAADLGRTTLVAHSFGAASALYAAARAPDRVARVIVLDAHVFRANPTISPIVSHGSVVTNKVYPSREEAIARYRLAPPGKWPNPEILRYIAANSLRQDANGWSWKFDQKTFRSVHKQDIAGVFRGRPLAVDFVHAQQSEVVGKAEIAAFLANMPGCGPVVPIAQCHHHLMIEQPVELVKALNGFLAQ